MLARDSRSLRERSAAAAADAAAAAAAAADAAVAAAVVQPLCSVSGCFEIYGLGFEDGCGLEVGGWGLGVGG